MAATVAAGTSDAEAFQAALLGWYDQARRDLPWRAQPGVRADPYRVWLSEIMLQQTTVKAVIPYFEAFLARWPTVADLARTPRDDVLAAWAGLGYYSRARNLHACAQALSEHGFPQTEEGLRRLPGVGAYTAAAIASIAFNVKATVIDGNVERVIARLYAIETPLPKAKDEIRLRADTLTSSEQPGDYAQAMMDLGATVCIPRTPRCLLCPVRTFCKAAKTDPSRFPVKAAKPVRPTRVGRAFVVVALRNGELSVLLRRRSENGLLGGMLEPPNTAWRVVDASASSSSFACEGPTDNTRPEGSIAATPESAVGELRSCEGGSGASGDNPMRRTLRQVNAAWVQGETVRHTFTHFELDFAVSAILLPEGVEFAVSGEGIWVPVAELKQSALPTVMLRAVMSGLTALHLSARYAPAGKASKRRSRVSTVDASAPPSTSSGRK